MPLRKIVFWSHLVAGVAAGSVILFLAITGVLLTYEVQITRWAERGFDIATADTGADTGPGADQLARIALDQTGGQASALVFERNARAPVVAVAGADKVFLDPRDGAVLGQGPTATQAFFETVTHLHRWLSFSGRSETGAAVTGAANLVFGFLLISGIWLWLPRVWKWGMLKTRILLRAGYPNAKARDFAWHHVFAFWAAVPLCLVISSGVVIAYPWASNLVFAAYGEQAPARLRPQGEAGAGPLAVSQQGGLQQVLERAQGQDPDWTRITLTLPKGAVAGDVRAMVDTGTGKQLARQETVVVSQDTGEVLAVSGLADRSPATRARMWFRFVHTGEVYGLVGQTIAGLASLAAIMMVYTGLALSYRRLILPILRRH